MSLDELYRGFREDYLDYEALTAQVKAWAEAHGDVCRLQSLATTPEGRELWLLTIGPDPDRLRPAAWVDGNMHASELAGSSAALAVAEDALRLHTGEGVAGLPAPVARVCAEGLLYVMPRVSPDGAEAVLRTGRYVRSVPRDERTERRQPRWVAGDVDGDGLALLMRVEDPTGEFVPAPEFPGLLVPRRIEDEGPFYKVYPEGTIAHWDGVTIPDPSFLADNDPDLNRNFPYHWAPEPEQIGAGRFPISEVESRAIVEFVSARPNIFAWLNLHTFGGVHIRPLGDRPDSKMEPSDLALYRQVEEWADELTGYPTVSGFEQFTYEPDKPLHGDLSDFAYHQRGALAWVCEIWDLFERVGLPKKKRFVDRYTQLDREHLIAIARWDAEHNGGAVLRPWRPVEHPQLGAVEVGGLDPRFGLWNPPRDQLPAICTGLSGLLLRAASLQPRIVLGTPQVRPLASGLHEVVLTVDNRGYLPTYGLASAKPLPWNEPLQVEVEGEGVEVLGEGRTSIGHLEGWGRGRWGGSAAIYYQRSRGSVSRRRLRWTVRGQGCLTVRVTGPRVGATELSLDID